MAGPHENLEHAEHAEHAAHSNKKIALLIAVIALFLAFSETLGKSAQTAGISDNVEAANLWAFFQAKTIRRTLVETAAQQMAIEATAVTNEATKTAMAKQVDFWKSEAARYRSEPSTKEGSTELAVRAKAAEIKRDVALARYHNYEIASAAYQIGIVLASAAVITGMMMLAYGAGGLGVLGIVFMGLGLFAPDFLHDVTHWFESLFAGSAH